MNEQAMNPNAPAFARSSPRAYYAWLTSQGLGHREAYDQTTSIFGAPKTPNQLNNDKAKSDQTAGLAQAGGYVGGAVLTSEIMRGFPNIKDAFKSTPPTDATNVGTTATPASQAQWNAGADAASKATPQVISTDGAMSTVQTPTGPQQVPTESLNDPGFWNSVNWTDIAQGAAGLAQVYGAYKSYKAGDKLGAGLQGATGAGNLALATGAASNTGTLGATVIPGLNIATGAYGAYKTAEQTGEMAAGKQRDTAAAIGGASSGLALGLGAGALAGAAMGSWAGPIGMAVGAAAGYVGSKYFGSSKKKPQVMRDAIRGVLQERGVLDENFQGTLADGSKYDFGKDGSTLKWKNIDKIAAAQPKAWNAAVPAADALAASYGFVGQKASDLAAWYAKGAVSNAGNDGNVALSNMQHFAKQQGITMDLVKSKLDEALKDQRITQDKYNYYIGGAQQLLGGAAASQPAVVQRAEKGKVVRQSPGLYRDDKGKLVAASTMKQALSNAYNKTKEKK
jgi:hypothetical protein